MGENAGLAPNDQGSIDSSIETAMPGGLPKENWLSINRGDEGIGDITRIYFPGFKKMKAWEVPQGAQASSVASKAGGCPSPDEIDTSIRRQLVLAIRFNPQPFIVAALGAALAFPVSTFAQSSSDCAARADRASRDSSGVLGGAVKGGAGGALFGAIVSDKSSKGAKRGAALGAVVGGVSGAYNKDQTYKRVYDNCMAGH